MMANAIDTARLSQVHFKKQVHEWKIIRLRENNKDLYDKPLKAFYEEDRKVNEYLQNKQWTLMKTDLASWRGYR